MFGIICCFTQLIKTDRGNATRFWSMDHSYMFIFNISNDISKDGASLQSGEGIIACNHCLFDRTTAAAPHWFPECIGLHISEANCTAFHTKYKSTITECLKGLDDLCLNCPKQREIKTKMRSQDLVMNVLIYGNINELVNRISVYRFQMMIHTYKLSCISNRC